MDLRQYFKKIKDTEASIEEEYPVIVSLETSDGGRPGVATEVARQEAARAIVENRGVLASEEQKKAYYAQVEARRKAVEKADLGRRLQIAIVSEPEVRQSIAKQEKDAEPKSSK